MVNQEIERKFLLKKLPEGLSNGVIIYQGYLSNKDPEVRVRKIKNINTEKFVITQKTGEGIARSENEEEISENVFNILWPLTYGLQIKKIRFKVKGSYGLVWEIDKYEESHIGLFIAEVEIPNINTVIEMPDSIKKVLIKEVTNDKSYKNKRLALLK